MGTGAKLAAPAGPADAVARWDLAAAPGCAAFPGCAAPGDCAGAEGVARLVSTKAAPPRAARAAPAKASAGRRRRWIQPVIGRVGLILAAAAPAGVSVMVSLAAETGRGAPGAVAVASGENGGRPSA